MSNRYRGGVISKTPPATTTSSATGIWSSHEYMQSAAAGTWPRIPAAPTIGTATAGGNLCASVAFTAPTDVGFGTLTYTATSSPGGLTATGASSPVVVSGLTLGTSYTFTVRGATPGGSGPSSAASNSITAVVRGSQSYTSAGTYSWVAPAGVTSVSVVTVGGGGAGGNNVGCCSCAGVFSGAGGGGGGLGYINNYAVTPGSSYTVVIGNSLGSSSYFVATTTVQGIRGQSAVGSTRGTGGGFTGTGGGTGGSGGIGGGNTNTNGGGGGGGAAGYSGNGGDGAAWNSTAGGLAGAACSGAGGGGSRGFPTQYWGSGGGGVGILGRGATGAAAPSNNQAGNAGSGGTNGTSGFCRGGGTGGVYGAGGGGRAYTSGASPGIGGSGAVRIVWPGNTRTFPATDVGSP